MKKVYLKDLQSDEVIRRLKAGEAVKHVRGNYEKKLISGVICTTFNKKGYVINDCITSDESACFEEPEEFKLEVGKSYKTRDGRKAFIFVKDDYNYRGVVVGSAHDYAWRENGKSVYSTDDNDLDLISEWSDNDVAKN